MEGESPRFVALASDMFKVRQAIGLIRQLKDDEATIQIRRYTIEAMKRLHDELDRQFRIVVQGEERGRCSKCGGSMIHTRLKGYRCPRCD